MLKHILGVFILGVLLKEASADIECFLNKTNGEIRIPENEQILCNGFVDNLRQQLKNCEVTKVSLDELDSYVKELCTPGSQLNKDKEASQQCFQNHIFDVVGCIPKVDPKETSIVTRTKEVCKKRKDIYSCMKDKLGKPCGEAGMYVITKGQDVEESYMKDICSLIGGAGINSVVMWLVVLCVSITMLKSR